MEAAEKLDYISPEAYLQTENDRIDDIKCEYANGYVYAMAGASRNHNLVAGNFFLNLGMHLRGKVCRVFQSDMKVRISTLGQDYFYYPDVHVSCENEQDNYCNTEPCLIVEVLSNSTARIDRTEKLNAYRLLPSLQEYVLCSQDYPAIELYRRSNDWKTERYVAGQAMALESVGMELVLDELYDFLLSDPAFEL